MGTETNEENLHVYQYASHYIWIPLMACCPNATWRSYFYFSDFLFVSLEDEDSDAPQDANARDSEDEAEWDRLQADVKGRDNVLDPKSKESHIVHAPYVPEVNAASCFFHCSSLIFIF